jgi:anti-sigma factor RsiW
MNAPNCERESDLISFLYGELSAAETPAFERHLQQCASCSAELTGFKNVRESVVAWRNESLSAAWSPSSPAVVAERKPSAMAALREFFNLSPLWLKGAVAFATLVLCILAGLAVVRMQNKPEQPIVKGYTEKDVQEMLAKRLAEERARVVEQSRGSEEIVKAGTEPSQAGQPSQRGIVVKHRQVEYAKRPLSKTEREQLAADLRLLSSGDSDIDLLSDSINQ